MSSFYYFLAAALCEIAGCYAFWLYLRLDKSPFWLIPACISLMTFAVLLTRVEAAFAGRAFAAYGGIYIASSVAWMAIVEGVRPTSTDLLGATLCIFGALVIVVGPKLLPAS